MTDLSPSRYPGRVVVRPMVWGGLTYEWAVFAQGNYVTSFATRSEAEETARVISREVTLDAGDES